MGSCRYLYIFHCLLFTLLHICFLHFYSNYISKPDKLLKEMLKYHETAVYKFFIMNLTSIWKR